MSGPETRRTCVLAMSRLSESTAMDDGFLAGAIGEDMLIVHVSSEPNEAMPSDLAAVAAWARQRFDYIIFDRDVDPLEDGGPPDLLIAGYEN